MVSDACTQNLSIAESKVNFIVINPVLDKNIQFNKEIELNTIKIYDINGRLVYENHSYSGNSLKIYLNPSIYFLQMYIDKKVIIKKIIVR